MAGTQSRIDSLNESISKLEELKARITKLEQNVTVIKKELRFKKNRKFQNQCIQKFLMKNQ